MISHSFWMRILLRNEVRNACKLECRECNWWNTTTKCNTTNCELRHPRAIIACVVLIESSISSIIDLTLKHARWSTRNGFVWLLFEWVKSSWSISTCRCQKKCFHFRQQQKSSRFEIFSVHIMMSLVMCTLQQHLDHLFSLKRVKIAIAEF